MMNKETAEKVQAYFDLAFDMRKSIAKGDHEAMLNLVGKNAMGLFIAMKDASEKGMSADEIENDITNQIDEGLYNDDTYWLTHASVAVALSYFYDWYKDEN